MSEMYDNPNTVEKTFDAEFLSEELRQAQWAEFIELKKIITKHHQTKGKPITILDIGVGNARILKHLSQIKEMWEMAERYDGIDNSNTCITISNKAVDDLKLKNKVSVKFFNAMNLDKWKQKYDLIICTWFTAGNFYPNNFPFETYAKSKNKIDLRTNKKFETIFRNAYSLLNRDGEIVIGSCYIDNDQTRQKQEAFYKKCGMTIITQKNETFTATKEHFWSQRFTRAKIKNYLSFVSPTKIRFTPLDTYDYAMLIQIKK